MMNKGMADMLNENIKTTRKNRGFTQEELAARLHVTRQTVSKWERGYSVPDAQLLSEMADIFNVSVSELLGADKIESTQPDLVVEQLSRINEQLAIKNRRAHRFWKAAGIILLALMIGVCSGIAVGIHNRAQNNQEAGRTSWACALNGKTYDYMVSYNKDYQILASGGDAYVDNHVDMDQYDDANKAAAHLKDYFTERGGKVKVVSQKHLKLEE
ncbi:MAG: helix-turn-helix domain-containing protein [Eubacterium sp.]|jgi:putative transcriptional regulator|nr:helix-turn-helix domain-containing protein [Eubacterium sp.]